MAVTLIIEGAPRTKGREIVRVGKRSTLKANKATVEYEQRVALAARTWVDREAPVVAPWECFGPFGEEPLRLTLTFVKNRPGRLIGRKKSKARLPAPVRPDADNVAKVVQDGLQRCTACLERQSKCSCPGGVRPAIADDAHVVLLEVRKVYAGWSRIRDDWERPHVEVMISRYGP